MGLLDRLKGLKDNEKVQEAMAKAQDPENREKVKVAAQAQMEKRRQRAQGAGSGMGRPMGTGYNPMYPGGYPDYPMNQQDSDGDGIPDNMDSDPYGDQSGVIYDDGSQAGAQAGQDVQYVDENGNPVDSADVESGAFVDPSDSTGYASGADTDYQPEYQDQADTYSYDNGGYDSGSSDSGGYDGGYDSGGGGE